MVREKIKIVWIFVLFLFLGIMLVGAKNQSITVPYSFSNDTLEERTVDFSSVLLRVTTDRDATCRYSTVSKGYNEMEGNFDLTYGKLHEKSFTGLGDGIYKYYVRCLDVNGSLEGRELEIILRVNSLVTGQIILSEEAPLKAGKTEITLLTSKIVSQTPSLSYSFEGIVYNPIGLIGSEKIWKGFLIIPKNLGEAVVFFRFKANDLEGRQGGDITNGGVYVIDTIKPKIISDINAVGYKGEVKLEWHLDDDAEEFNVYRSTSPNPDYTDFYKTTDDSPFGDTSVDEGKTYYYKVAAVDGAGNEADLSKEVYATALLNNDSSVSSGLALELRGHVDNFLTETESVLSEIKNIRSTISIKQGSEKALFTDLKLEKEITDAESELNALKRDVDTYKLQDLTKEELNQKLNSARLRLNIIKRKVPESLIILGEESRTEGLGEGAIGELLLELKQDISEKEKEESIKQTIKIIEESNLEIQSIFYIVEIIYLDGTKKSISIVKRVISGGLERKENTFFVEIVPKDVAESVSDLDIGNLDYSIIKEDPILSFSSDTKNIIYSFNNQLSLSSLRAIKTGFVFIYEEEEIESKITGYYLLDLAKRSYIGILIGIVLIIALLGYFVYSKKNKNLKFLPINKKIRTALELLKKREIKQVREIYSSIKEDYKNLEKKEKQKVYGKIEFLRNKILVFNIKRSLEHLETQKDKELFDILEKNYNKLPDKFKKEILNFEKIKKEMGKNED